MPKKNFVAGTVLRAADVNEYLSTSRNVILNSDFSINQRSFTSVTTSGTYGHDRWRLFPATGTTTYSPQSFTPGAAPVTGYESAGFARVVTSGQSGSNARATLNQAIEDVRTFAGQTVTVSFFAKAASGTPKVAIELIQVFGSGGSPSSLVETYAGQVTISTAWARYSVSIALPALTGKTIGTTANTSSLDLNIWFSAGTDFNARTGSLGVQNNTFDIWGIQVEEGSTATPFARATPTIASELTACQRYFQRLTHVSAFGARSTTSLESSIIFPVEFRIPPAIVASNVHRFYDSFGAAFTQSSASANLAVGGASTKGCFMGFNNFTGLTQGRIYVSDAQTLGSYVDFSAEF